MKKLTLFATIGFPGSGKTYFSERFAKQYGLFHLNPDRLRSEMVDRPVHTKAEHGRVFRVMDIIAEYLLMAGVSLIYDANTTKKTYRDRLRQIAKKYKARFILLNFQTPIELAVQRLKKRGRLKAKHKLRYYKPIGEKVLHQIRLENQLPKKNEPHINIDGRKPYQEQLKVLKEIL